MHRLELFDPILRGPDGGAGRLVERDADAGDDERRQRGDADAGAVGAELEAGGAAAARARCAPDALVRGAIRDEVEM